ncbi:PREDICTED: pro-opiomelanocortin-like [Cyprinodon variegatus]|uniref:Pro-opiomelanocortin-like n=1 Tax=Cyprinodon variegatus TaxID=28743 RepID=A0A3Q2EID4_CYPVA|nr:PREDICTED: pro-opiomelanocortin-like [Cyprinodon variegatus]
MLHQRWLFMILIGCMCSSGSGSVCLESSTCNDRTDEDKIQDCLHLCTSSIESEIKPLGVADQQDSDGFGDSELTRDNEKDDLLLSIILSTLASKDKAAEDDLDAHDDQRRSYAMEHFRWGKPFGRKRRPVKVFPSDVDEDAFPLRARRQVSWNKAETKDGVVKGNSKNLHLLRSRPRFRSQTPQGLPERKAETYKMSHFRWGSPPASKPNGGLKKLWDEKPRGKIAKLLKNILEKDVKIMLE